MNDFIKIIYEVIANIPSNLMVTGVVAYLIWERNNSKKEVDFHKKEHQAILDQIEELKEAQTEDVNAHDKIFKLLLRSCIVNKEFPRNARLEMYDEYKKSGYNSWVDAYVEKNLLSPEPEHNRRKDDNKF